jgi:hypothetical protein
MSKNYVTMQNKLLEILTNFLNDAETTYTDWNIYKKYGKQDFADILLDGGDNKNNIYVNIPSSTSLQQYENGTGLSRYNFDIYVSTIQNNSGIPEKLLITVDELIAYLAGIPNTIFVNNCENLTYEETTYYNLLKIDI